MREWLGASAAVLAGRFSGVFLRGFVCAGGARRWLAGGRTWMVDGFVAVLWPTSSEKEEISRSLSGAVVTVMLVDTAQPGYRLV